MGPCWGPACTGLAPEDSGCQEMAGPSLAGAANDAGQGSVIYVPWLGDKEKGTFTSSLLSRIWGAFKKGMPFQLNLKDKVFLRKKSDFSNLC